MVQTTRIKTGMPELDNMLRSGFLQGDAVMVAGSAGTGKTTLSLQYLVNGITQYNDRGIYVSFEQLPDQIYRDAKSFGWDLRKLEEENKLRIVCTSPDLLLDAKGSILDEPVKEIQPSRIVIDSLSHLEMYVEEKDLRKELYRLIMHLKTKGLSSLLTWESPQMAGTSFSVSESGVSFLVDCIILLKLVEIESSVKKAIVIVKMRGSDHDKSLREYEITSSGLNISSPFSEYEGVITGSPRKSFTEKAAKRWAKAFTE